MCVCVLNLTKLGQSDASAQELHNTMPRGGGRGRHQSRMHTVQVTRRPFVTRAPERSHSEPCLCKPRPFTLYALTSKRRHRPRDPSTLWTSQVALLPLGRGRCVLNDRLRILRWHFWCVLNDLLHSQLKFFQHLRNCISLTFANECGAPDIFDCLVKHIRRVSFGLAITNDRLATADVRQLGLPDSSAFLKRLCNPFFSFFAAWR